MRRRQPLPRRWLMTDERIGDIVTAVASLPRGSGIVFRHYGAPKRRALFDRVRALARRRGHVLILADRPCVARAWRADGAHERSLRRSRGIRTMAVHDRVELRIARAARADLIFVSPVFATRSHPGARPLGPARLGLLVGAMRGRVVALGGMSSATWQRLNGLGLYGWAGIDAFRI